MVNKTLPQTNIELHDLITIFNDIIAKHVSNINDKRDEISKLRTEIETKYALVNGNEHEMIELKNANKLSRERMLDLENDLTEANKKIEELEEALAHSYDSGLEAVHPDDYPDVNPPEPTPAELMAYCEDRIQEFIREDLSEAKDINHIIDIKFIPKSFTIIDKDNVEVFYYYNDEWSDPHNQGYYSSYESGEGFEHNPLTKELFIRAYLRAAFTNALKKPKKQ